MRRNSFAGRATAAFVLLLNSACGTLEQENSLAPLAEVELHNPSHFFREDEPLYWSFHELGLDENIARARAFVVEVEGDAVPSETLDWDSDGQDDGIFTVLDFSAGATLQARLRYADPRSEAPRSPKRTQAELSVKTGGEWHPREGNPAVKDYVGGVFSDIDQVTPPEFYTDHSQWIRFEGPGIESDRVGYRVYLDWRNGFDVFGKKIAAPVLQEVGLDGYQSYHSMQPWGMDLLKVGASLGAGGFGYWGENGLVHLQEVDSRTATVVEDGLLYSSLNLHYDNWQLGEQAVHARAHLRMHAGSRPVRNTISLSPSLPNLAIGFVAHDNTTRIEGPAEIPGDAYTYLASWGPQSLAGDDLGLAVFFKKGDLQSLTTDGSSHIAVMDPAGGKLEYYFGAAWQGEGGTGVKNLEEFKRYLDQQTERLTRPIRQRLKTQRSRQAKQPPLDAQRALAWSQALADAELQRKALDYHADGWDLNRKRKPKFEYDIVGLLPLAYDELAEATGIDQYGRVKREVTASFVREDGSIQRYELSNYNIDSIMPGRVLLRLYQEDPQPKYHKALKQLREQLHKQPRTANGAFWHKQRYPHQLWLDGVYMGMPFLAEYSQLFEGGASLPEVVKEFRIVEQVLKDPKTGLYFHAWDESRQQPWADPHTGLSPQIWGRGVGWLAMGLVDVLDYLPEERSEDRQFLEGMVVELAKALKRHQDPETGTWWQVMDRPNALGNYRESTATAMFSYFLAKAINKGYLTDANFGDDVRAFALSSYRGLIDEFVLVHPDHTISMTNQCLVAGLGFGRDGSYDYYMDEQVFANDPKGTGPFILAGVEVSKLLQSAPIERAP